LLRIARFASSVIAGAAITLLGAAVLIFLAVHLVPGGFGAATIPTNATPAARAAFIHRLGIDQPLPTQFVKWFGALLHGDLGRSLISGTPVSSEIASHAPTTIELTLLATLLSILVGLPLGAVAAFMTRKRFIAGLTRASSSLTLAVPSFVVGTGVVYLASIGFLGMTLGIYVPFSVDPVGNLKTMALPSVVLGLFTVGLIARTTRDAVLAVLTQPFVTAAVARGESPGQIMRRHIFRNAVSPVITVLAVNVGYLLGGAVIIEEIFSLPGLGQYAFLAIQHRDYAQVEGVVIVSTLIFIILSVLADVAYALIDPRITLQRASS
jgi:peptide/nickel transport system permease protein